MGKKTRMEWGKVSIAHPGDALGRARRKSMMTLGSADDADEPHARDGEVRHGAALGVGACRDTGNSPVRALLHSLGRKRSSATSAMASGTRLQDLATDAHTKTRKSMPGAATRTRTVGRGQRRAGEVVSDMLAAGGRAAAAAARWRQGREWPPTCMRRVLAGEASRGAACERET
jgi:hypothetical protein